MATPCSTRTPNSNSDGCTLTHGMSVANVPTSTASYTVYVRIKPLDVLHPTNELCEEHYSATDKSITTNDSNKKHEIHQNTFKFAKVFLPIVSQTEIFTTAIEPRLRDFFDFKDSLIFSYGTSSSGKSHTMQGTPSNPGIIPRVLRTIYESLSDKLERDCKLAPYKSNQAMLLSKSDLVLLEKEKKSMFLSLTAPSQASGDVTISEMAATDMLASLGDALILPTCIKDDEVCSLWVSFFEVYNEQVFDLLAFRQDQKLQPLGINMDSDDNSYYPSDLKHFPAVTWDEAYDLYRFGKKNLHVTSTLLNRKSSRSHGVFTVKMLARPKTDEGRYYPTVSFSICDLAGSERMVAHRNSKAGISLKEMKSINNSLLALNKCFIILKRGNNSVLPPFRDSQLTKLIKKFLIEQGKLVMIATISQSPELLPQTQQILKMTSIAHTTKVITQEPTPTSHVLKKNTQKRRFSSNYQCELPSRNCLHLPQISEDALPDRVLEGLTQRVQQLSLDKETLLNENRTFRDEKNKAVEDLTRKREEYDLLKESHNRQAQYIVELEAKFNVVESSKTDWYKKVVELTQQLSDKSRKYFEEKINLQRDLSLARMDLKHVIRPIKEHFSIDSNDPVQIVQRAIYLVNDMRTAATEEIGELEEELSKCQEELAAKTQMLEEEMNQLKEELDVYRQSELVKVETEKISPADGTLSDMDENEYRSFRSRRFRFTTGRLEDQQPYVPIREIKTSTKKRRTKKATTKSKGASLQSEDRPDGGSQRRNPRRFLLADVDCLPDDFVSNDSVSPRVQLSPGSAMKSLRRSSRKK